MHQNGTVRAVLWDMDGVLIDSEPWYNITVRDMMHSLGYEYGEKEIAKVTGSSYKNIAEILNLDVPKENIMQLYLDALIKAINCVSCLVDGVIDVLDYLKSHGMKLAIGSSSPREVVDFAVKKFGLTKWIDVIVTGSDAANGKPAPDIYLKCAELLGIQPFECLVIEDSINGIRSGKNAGMRVCAFTGTKHHDFDLSSADFELVSYSADALMPLKRWIITEKR